MWSHGRDGEWTPLAKSEATLTAVVAAGDAVFAGTDDARVLRLAPSGALEPLAGFDTVAGRDEWHQVGSPLAGAHDDRDLRRRGGARERARGWHPAVDRRWRHVAADARRRRRRAPGARAPDASGDRGRRRVGRSVPQSRRRRDVDVDHRRHGPHVRARCRVRRRRRRRHRVRRTVGVARGACTARRSTAVPRQRSPAVSASCTATSTPRCVASDGKVVALADGGGDVWRSADRVRRLRAIAAGLDGVTGVTVA